MKPIYQPDPKLDLSFARAHGMTEIAKASGLTREALYKHFGPMPSRAMTPLPRFVRRWA